MLSFSLNLEPEAALRFFRRKGLRESFSWKDMWQEEHDAAFTVAKMMDLDLLRDMREAVDRAIDRGESFGQFRKQIEPELVKAGWWGRAEMEDPLTGDLKSVQLGSVRRLQTIYRVNMQAAYSAGDWEQINDAADDAPYLMYDAIDDDRTRPSHKAWDGKVLRWDDPWWQAHRPPNGWNCRCSTIQLSADDLQAMGKSVDDAPPVVMREYTNDRTGDVSRVPAGIDPGWAYNPGAQSLRQHHAQLFTDRVAAAPAAIGAAAFESLARDSRSFTRSIDDGWSRFVDAAISQGDPRRQSFTVGAMSRVDVEFLESRGIYPASAEIAAEDRLITSGKVLRHQRSGDGLIITDLKRLPQAVRSPDAVLFDTANNTLLYVTGSTGDDRKTKIVVRSNFLTARPKKQLNAIITAFKVGTRNLIGQEQFVLVRGKL